MGFDPEFLQQLNDSYGELHHDDMDGLDFGGFEIGDQGAMGPGDPTTNPVVPAAKQTPASDSGFSSAQVHSRSTSAPFSEPSHENFQHF
jgi:hypothetical protein